MASHTEYDLSLAVQAIRTLRAETHDFQERDDLVWKPIRYWFQRLIEEVPQEIVCLHDGTKESCFVYLLVPDNRIIYLCTVVTEVEAGRDFVFFQENNWETAGELKKRGLMTIVRYWLGCNVPVSTSQLTQEAIEQGVQRYLQEFAPQLVTLPIKWLDRHENISRTVFLQAFRTRKHQTDEEKKEILSRDFD